MDGRAWWAAVHGITKSRTQLSNFTFTFHFHALEKEMATHSSVLAWRILGTGESCVLPSMGSHRVRHDWSDLAAATKCETLLSCKNSLSEKLLKQNWYWLGNLGSEEVPQILNLCVFSFSRSDCVEILKKCGDQNKFPEDHTAESICELLSPTDDLENCIPLDTYLSESFFFF